MKTEVLDELFGARDALSDMIIALSPTDDASRKALGDLLARRDRLTGCIRAVIASEFDDFAVGLAEKLASLAERTHELENLKRSLDQVIAAIGIVDKIVQVTGAIVSIAAKV